MKKSYSKKSVHKRATLLMLLLLTAITLAACGTSNNPDAGNNRDAVEAAATMETPRVQDIAAAQALSPAQIFEDNAEGVFTVYASFDGQNFGSNGSGFFVCDTGIAVTNHHVIVGWPYARIRTNTGHWFDVLGYYSYDTNNDLAVLRIEGRNFAYLTMGDSDALRIGESVFAIGSPLGYHNTFSTGIISRFDDVAEFDIYRVYNMIQMTAPISGGSSGGALLNEYGHVIGVTTAAYGGDVAQAINFAVPISRVDMRDVRRRNMSELPIGDVIDFGGMNIVGSWTWSGGPYNIYADGTGNRVWDGVPADFTWQVSGGTITFDVQGSTPEHWAIVPIDDNTMTIGGAVFTRVGAAVGTAAVSEAGILGLWEWDQGIYFFVDDNYGWREWSGVEEFFEWEVIGSTLHIYNFPDGSEAWEVVIIDNNRITVGGAAFTRLPDSEIDRVLQRLDAPATDADVIGLWEWDQGIYLFVEGGYGWREWNGVEEFLMWEIVGDRITIYTDDTGMNSWEIVRLGSFNIEIGGSVFERLPDDYIAELLEYLETIDAFSAAYAQAQVLVGTWDWVGGWYTFYPAFMGTRYLNGATTMFQWDIINSTLVLSFPQGEVEEWALVVVDDNSVFVGGAEFTRR